MGRRKIPAGFCGRSFGDSFGPIDWSLFDLIHHVLRKTGHAMGFGVLGLLLWRAFRRTFLGAPLLANAALAIAGVFLTGALDEWHQSFSPRRGAAFSDVMLDTSGALVFVSVALMLALRRRLKSHDEAGGPEETGRVIIEIPLTASPASFSNRRTRIGRNGRLTLLALFRKKCRFPQSQIERIAICNREEVNSLFWGLYGILYAIWIGSGKRSRLMAIPYNCEGRRPEANQKQQASRFTVDRHQARLGELGSL